MEEETALQPRGCVRPIRPRRLTPAALRELGLKPPSEILLRLANVTGGLDELVRNTSLDNEMLFLLLDLIGRTFTQHSLQHQSGQIRSIIDKMLKTDFINFTVLKFLVEGTRRSREENLIVVNAVLALADFALVMSPSFARPKVFMFPPRLREQMKDFLGDPALKHKLERIEAAMRRAEAQKDSERRHQDMARGMRVRADGEHAAGNFRALPLIPTPEDLTADEEIFVRRIRDMGRYDNLEDYLDVQFRLFRADFVIPLRESIYRYLGSHDAESSRDSGRRLRMYRDVQIVHPVCTDKDIAYRLSFDVGPFSSVDWRTSQRLKYGSLVCLSSDNFQTYLCATVKEHDHLLLSNGLVDVIFVLDRHDLAQVIDVPRDQRFVMMESPAYFEAYRHVLQGLKNLNDHNVPFIPYLVECQRDIRPPRYLQRDGNVKYDFRPLLDDMFVIKDEEDTVVAGSDVEAGGVEVMSGREWPSREDIKLDGTQYQALHNALTRELAIVQGPPGTGKTYLGLKIIKMLLQNSKAWNDPNQKRPLLIVCYTNHALDQFLEGMLDFFKGSLVRVGGRSNSDRLKEVNLANHRIRAKETRKIPMEVHEARRRARLELQELRITIHEKAAKLEIAEQEIVQEEFFKDFISAAAMQDFKRSVRKGEEVSAILKWLKLERIHKRLQYQAEHRLKTLPSYQKLATSSQRGHGPRSLPVEDEDEFEDDVEDDEVVDVSSSFRDSTQARKLDVDDDDDDLLYLDLDLDGLDLDREETESERLRRRQREIEDENKLLRELNVALDITGFCTDMEVVNVQDRTISKPNKAKDKEVADSLKKLTLQYKRRLQALLRSVDRMTLDEAEKVANPWELSVKERWRLYRLWTDLFCKQTRGEIREHEESYFDKARKYREILDQEDRSILEKQTVIGMTTTGAARYQSILHEIGPRVIVVEEAAEVFEAHVVATLSGECQHLILIGDHQQLRPSPTVHDLAKKCNLDISLFERMVKNNVPFDRLGFQHRMRPDISCVMKLLYPDLEDHDVVKGLPPVKGVSHNVYYITHSRPENRDEETKSYSNPEEAKYVVALCGYLLKQTYRPEQITILTPYSGQIRTLGQKMPRKEFEGVRVSSVDNFQGEENDIILLSLVRSNNDNDIGFLKLDNRICVALSRAKIGLYVVGNLELLQNSSTLLRRVVEHASAKGIFGTGLPLACQNHPRDPGIVAETAEDFEKAPEGGCHKPCNIRLPCGHLCMSICHPNEGHSVCLLKCSRTCAECGQRCDGDHACCAHQGCTRPTEKVIPRCGHPQMVPCGTDAIRADCQAPCKEVLPCGHQCQSTCGRPCTRQCQVKVVVTNERCGHQYQAACFEKDTAMCSDICGQELVCGHVCTGTCGQCQRGRLHVQCQKKCRKVLVCGHDCTASCCQCPPCDRPCQNRCCHSVCDRRCGEACVPCAMECAWQCRHHACSQRCGDPCDRQRCDKPCPERLDCDHRCPGLCGETCPPFCLECDRELLTDLASGELAPEDHLVFLEDCCHVVEVTFLDQWVDMSRNFQTEELDVEADDITSMATGAEGEAGNEGEEGRARRSRVIKFPECPQCRTPIRQNLRYGNIIKEALRDMEIIKQLCRGNQSKVDALYRKVDDAKRRVPADVRPKVEAIFTKGEVQSESKLATQFYQLDMVTDASHLLQQVASAEVRWPDMKDTYDAVKNDLDHLMTWMLTPRAILSGQELFDGRQESQRLAVVMHLLHCRHAISEDDIQVAPRLMRRLAASIRQLMAGRPVSENDLEEGRQLREELKDAVPDPYSALTDREREEIVKAVSLPTGSWYACPRGHYYVIGECGRPLEKSSCPECHSSIGGEAHALEGGNRHAPEFDNATGPRWTPEEDEQFARLLQMEEWENWQ